MKQTARAQARKNINKTVFSVGMVRCTAKCSIAKNDCNLRHTTQTTLVQVNAASCLHANTFIHKNALFTNSRHVLSRHSPAKSNVHNGVRTSNLKALSERQCRN